MIRVLIVAATPMLRAGLRTLLANTELTIQEEIASLHGIAHHHADAILLADALLLDTLDNRLQEPLLPMVVLDDESQTALRLRDLSLSGWALLPTEATADMMVAAVTAVVQGLVVVTPELTQQVMSGRSSVEPPPEELTSREREVLELVSQGLPNKLIARQLQISEHTVKFHISSIYTKLGVSSRTEAVNRGARYGLITL